MNSISSAIFALLKRRGIWGLDIVKLNTNIFNINQNIIEQNQVIYQHKIKL